MLRLSGNFNSQAKGERAPALLWGDDGIYRGTVALPGDLLRLRLFGPETGVLLGGAAHEPAAVPASVPINMDSSKDEILVETPLAGMYEIIFDPSRHTLHVDLAPDAESGKDAATTALVRALRGSDQADQSDRQQRADALLAAFSDPSWRTPIQTTQSDRGLVTYTSVAFLQLGPIDSVNVPGTLSVAGDFNGWADGQDPMRLVLDYRVAYLSRQAIATRLEYRVSLHGQRHMDPHNPEVVWDGAALPPNLRNVLGGNVGDFNSVALSPDFVEPGSHLQHLTVKMAGQPDHDIYVYLPPGYDRSPGPYPTLYVHDGKDAIVRGHYDKALDDLIANKAIPAVVTVFIPAESDPTARLAQYSHFPDPYFLSTVQPQGQSFAAFVTGPLIAAVDKQYHTDPRPEKRAMLGIDMAGPFTFYVGWAPNTPFQRLASQSGRFGWGVTAQAAMMPPYISYLTSDRSASLKKLSLDWADMDQFQVAANDQLRTVLGTAYKVRFSKQAVPLNLPNPDVWDNWRSRLDATLTFLLND